MCFHIKDLKKKKNKQIHHKIWPLNFEIKQTKNPENKNSNKLNFREKNFPEYFKIIKSFIEE